jgi:hypothetical protein
MDPWTAMTARTFAFLCLLVAGTAHAKDSRAVEHLTDKLDRFEHALSSGKLGSLGTDGWSLWQDFADAGKDLKSDPAFHGLEQRWAKLSTKAAAAAGGHSTEILGDGIVPAEDKERGGLYDEVLVACHAAAKTSNTGTARDQKKLKDNYAAYEKALARAMRADPASVRHQGGHFRLFECEWQIAQARSELGDNAVMEVSVAKTYKACGYDQYVLRRLKMGGRWGAWEVDGVPGSNGYPLDCKNHPRASKVSGNMPSLIRQEFKYPGNAVWTISGPPTTAQDGLRIYQYQTIRVYGKDIIMQTSACGDTDKKLVCEASGSRLVKFFNAVAHSVARADAHRSAGEADRCKAMYKEARRDAEDGMGQYERARKRSDWDKTLKYKTRDDGVLSETKLVERLTELSNQADERSVGKYCQGS